MTHSTFRISFLFVLFLLAACGGGGSSTGGGSQALPPGLSGLTVEATEESPARLRFEVTEGAAELEFRYQLAGQAEQLCEGLGPNPRRFEAGASELEWLFAEEPGLVLSSGLTAGIAFSVRVDGQLAQVTNISLGNDAPEPTAWELPAADESGEYEGDVELAFTVRDSSQHAVSIAVEYQREGENSWHAVRPVGSTQAPEFAFSDVVASAAGTRFELDWDSAADLSGEDVAVSLRVRAQDAWNSGNALVAGPLPIDNNAPPVTASLDLSMVDAAGSVPVHVETSDPEQDPLQLVLQVRHGNQEFAELPTSVFELGAALQDAQQTKDLGIAAAGSWQRRFEVLPLADHQVRVLEGTDQHVLLGNGQAQGKLELLREHRVPRDLALSTGVATPLLEPVAGIPSGPGRALVLDRVGLGCQLVELDLETSTVLRNLWSSADTGRDLVWDARNEEALVLVGGSTTPWQIWRVDVEQGSAALHAEGGLESARALAVVEEDVCFVLTESELLRVDHLSSTVTSWAGGLSEAVDLCSIGGELQILEQAGRILALQPGNRIWSLVRAAGIGGSAQAIALAAGPDGTTLWALADQGGQTRLLQLPLDGGDVHLVANHDDGREVAFGADGTCLVLEGDGSLHLGGGVRWSSRITGVDEGLALVNVQQPLPAGLDGQQSARWVLDERGPGQLLWDSSAWAGLEVFVRAVAYDRDRGNYTSERSKQLRGLFEDGSTHDVGLVDCDALFATGPGLDGQVEVFASSGDAAWRIPQSGGAFADPVALPGQGSLLGAGDLDLDGRADWWRAHPSGLSVRWFAGGSQVLDHGVPLHQVEAADLDGDGDMDLFARDGTSAWLWSEAQAGSFTDWSSVPTALVEVDSLWTVVTQGVSEVVAVDGQGNFERFRLVFDAFASQGQGSSEGAWEDVAEDFQVLMRGGAAGAEEWLVHSYPFSGAAPYRWSRDPASLSAHFVSEFPGGGFDVWIQTSGGVTRRVLTGEGVSQSSILLALPTSFAGAWVAADFDLDGRVDLCSGDDLQASLQAGPVAWEGVSFDLSCGAPPLGDGLRIFDADGDRSLDLLSGGGGGGLWTQQVGLRSFSSSHASLFGDSSADIEGLDVDDDGDEDLLRILGSASGAVQLWRQTASGSYVGDLPIPIEARALTLGDFDGDGRSEALAGGYEHLWRIEDQAVEIAGSDFENAHGLHPVDIDGDGNLDLIVEREGVLSVWYGDGTGQLQRQEWAWSGSRLAVGDWDGDGALDLVSVAGASFGGGLTWSRQEAPRAFAPFAEVPLIGSEALDGLLLDAPIALELADLDGDGDLDARVANSGSSKSAAGSVVLFWQRHASLARVHRPLELGPSEHIQAARWSDLDGDGQQDWILHGGLAGCDLRVFWGR